MQLSSIDANLVVVLDALLQEASVERAARRIAKSPSATSHALARLRELLGDPLLTRAGRRLVLTERAKRLAPEVRRAVEATEGIFRTPELFRPQQLNRSFMLQTTDHIEIVLLRALDAILRTEAPQASLSTRPIGPDSIADLRSGQADLAFGIFADAPDDIRRQPLFSDRLVTLARKGHPALRRRPTLEQFAKLEHVLVAPRGLPGSGMDRLLARRGLERRVSRTLWSFMVAPFFAAESDLVVTMSLRLAQVMAPVLGLQMVEPPVPVKPYRLFQVWHRRNDSDPAHTWLRETIVRTAAALPAVGV